LKDSKDCPAVKLERRNVKKKESELKGKEGKSLQAGNVDADAIRIEAGICKIDKCREGDLTMVFLTLQTSQDVSKSECRLTCFYVSSLDTRSVTGTKDSC
jgi:hypothetical protein